MSKDVFQRKEIKYLMSTSQYEELRSLLDPIVAEDQYGKTQILNTYFDTKDFKLIRRAMEHPEYKEKLRLRSYGVPSDNSPSFVEIKKKFDGIVYKRRIELPYRDARNYLWKGVVPPSFDGLSTQDTAGTRGSVPGGQERQIQREIDYFLAYYHRLQPAMGIAYDRIALAGREDPELRITFDTNLRWSINELDLRSGNHGTAILGPDQVLMELKITGAMDLRIAHALSGLGIFHTSISKYGRGFEAYMQEQRRLKKNRDIYVIFSRPATVRSA